MSSQLQSALGSRLVSSRTLAIKLSSNSVCSLKSAEYFVDQCFRTSINHLSVSLVAFPGVAVRTGGGGRFCMAVGTRSPHQSYLCLPFEAASPASFSERGSPTNLMSTAARQLIHAEQVRWTPWPALSCDAGSLLPGPPPSPTS